MPLSQWNLEWLDHNSQRNYPLAEDATGFDETSSFQLPRLAFDGYLFMNTIVLVSRALASGRRYFINQNPSRMNGAIIDRTCGLISVSMTRAVPSKCRA